MLRRIIIGLGILALPTSLAAQILCVKYPTGRMEAVRTGDCVSLYEEQRIYCEDGLSYIVYDPAGSTCSGPGGYLA